MTSIASTLGVGSGIDTGALVTQLVTASRQAKDDALTAQSTKVTAQISGVSALMSGMTNFSTALKSLIDGGTLKTQPTSSDASVLTVSGIAGQSVSQSESAIQVQQLASAQSIATPAVADANAAIGTGTLTFNFGTATMDGSTMTGLAAGTIAPVSITIDSSNDTLTGIAAAINAKNAGITATVVSDANGARLVVKGATGAASAFTMTATEDADAPGLASLDFGPGAASASVNQSAGDAIVTYDGLSVHRSTNTITDLVPGVSLGLKAVSSSAVTIGAQRPGSAISEAVTDFVNAYNTLQGIIDTQTDKDTGSLNGDAGVRQMQNQLTKLTSTALIGSGHPATLAEIGVSTNRDGTLSLDTDKLTAAFAANPDQVEAMFNPGQTSSSALVRIVSATGATPAGSHSITNLQPATAGTLAGTASPNAFASPLVLDASNNVFHVTLDGGSAVDVTVPEGSYADGASFATALQGAIEANTSISVHAGISWDASTGTLSAASKTLGKASAISIAPVDSGLSDMLGLTGAVTAHGSDAAGTIDGKAATSVGSLLFADSSTAAKGLVIQPLAGATAATITVDLGLYGALKAITDALTGTSGALYTENAQLTSQQTDIKAQQQKVNDDADALKTQLTQQFATMDSRVAAYKSTQDFLTQQIAAWNKTDS